MLNKILKVLIYATIFLVPVFFLPITFDFLEFNKLYLLFFLVWVSVLVWLLKMIVEDKELKIKHSVLDYVILGFAGIAIISAVLSVDKFSSLFGYYGRFSDGLVALLSLAAFYFLIVNNIGVEAQSAKRKAQNEKSNIAERLEEGIISVSGVVKTLLCSGAVVMIFAYFALFGIWIKLAGISNQLSLIINKIALRVSPAAGTLEAMALFLVIGIVLAALVALGALRWGRFEAGLLVGTGSRASARGWKIFTGIFIVLATILLVIADYTPAWIILVISLIAVVALILRKRILKSDVHRLMLPIALIIISFLFLVLNFRAIVATFPKFFLNSSVSFLRERTLSQGESWNIAGSSLLSGLKQGLIGSGPGTFYYSFSKLRPESLNQGDMWAIRFDRSGSYASEILATMGILGLLGFLAVIITFFLKAFVFSGGLGRRFERTKQVGKLDYGSSLLIIVFLALVLIQFVYYQTIVLGFLFWLFLGIALGWRSVKAGEEPCFVKTKRFKLRNYVEMALVMETVLIVLFLGFVAACFFGFKFYLADIKYVQALNQPEIDKKIEILQEAIRLNPYQPRYQMVMSRVYLVKTQEGLANLPSGGDQTVIVQDLGWTRNFAVSAANTAPSQISAWQNLAELYQNMMIMAKEREQFGILAIDALKKASELEPRNPGIYTDIGNLYLLLAKKDEARAEFEKAVRQKLDFAPANINLALMLEEEERVDEAIAKLEWLLPKNPNNVETLFHLGRLYYNKNEIERAITQFITALNLNPQYSNARYSLAIAYEKQEKIKEAIEQLEMVLAANPDVQEVKERIERLKRGDVQPQEEMEEIEELEKLE